MSFRKFLSTLLNSTGVTGVIPKIAHKRTQLQEAKQ